ncbi:MutS-related protein [Acetanaerobacterium elongatum]|uniref:MutS domain V n=1 Tax=Acetanaerobacterium elongatum TaxID=258515 RepID=A0A1H0C0S8_9FIRM|nr:hypothetical protein [Acetanaerobacterium elongatum]SDN51457.1 MutS domain V [Acetanaerobacterium elongatum]
MKANLMYRDADFNTAETACSGWETLAADLELGHILAAMSRDDKVIQEACTAALSHPLTDLDVLRYRQENLNDALSNASAVRQLYAVTLETEKRRSGSWSWLGSHYISSTFSSAVNLLKIYTEMLMKLRAVADESLSNFRYEGFRNLLTMLQKELSDDYFHTVTDELNDLKEDRSVLISATMGNRLQGVHYMLRQKDHKNFWRRWMFAPSFTIAARDDAGARDLGARRDRAINESANALAQSAEHLSGFFAMLRRELAFYVGCLNLADTLHQYGKLICIPDLQQMESRSRQWQELYDVSLVLIKQGAAVGNSLRGDNKHLYLITGANQGGKSTFLRSLGQAQIMAQCGMFVGAQSCSIPIRAGIFSHFKKEEDGSMTSGKLDEELVRMSGIVAQLKPNSMILFNESFAATNEREGSEICRQITSALIENEIEVFSVTHLYPYAAAFLQDERTQYWRAQRTDSGERTFRLIEGKPLQTAFGEDLYERIFAAKSRV